MQYILKEKMMNGNNAYFSLSFSVKHESYGQVFTGIFIFHAWETNVQSSNIKH